MGKNKAYDKAIGQLENTYRDIGTWRGTIRNTPESQLLSNTYQNMISNPAARGLDQGTLSAMYGRQADVLSGARNAYQKSLGSQVAAQGLGNTGAYLRNLSQYDKNYAAQQRGAQRDVDIYNEQLKNENLWKSLAGLQGWEGTRLGLEQGSFGQQIGATAAEAPFLAQRYRPGFWGTFKNSLASGLGSGLAGLATGGLGNIPFSSGSDVSGAWNSGTMMPDYTGVFPETTWNPYQYTGTP